MTHTTTPTTSTATKARTGLIVALGTTALAGAGITWLNNLGDQL